MPTIVNKGVIDASPEAVAAMVDRLRYANDKVHTMPNSAARIYGDAAALLAQVATERDEARANQGVVAAAANILIDAAEARADTASRQLAEARAALLALANAADAVGVAFFDTDDLPPEIEAMQTATQEARALLSGETK